MKVRISEKGARLLKNASVSRSLVEAIIEGSVRLSSGLEIDFDTMTEGESKSYKVKLVSSLTK